MNVVTLTVFAATIVVTAAAPGVPSGTPAAPAAPETPAPTAAPAAPAAAPAGPEAPAWLGIVFGDALDGGVQVVAVVPGGPADEGGVREGDVLLAFGERATPDRAALLGVVRNLRPGEDVAVRLVRQGRTAVVELRPVAEGRREYPLFEPHAREIPRFAPRVGIESAAFAGCETARIPRDLRLHYAAPADSGVLVVRVESDGAAARAGLLVGDVIVKVADRPVEDPIEFAKLLARGTGGPIAIEVVRARKPIALRFDPAGPDAAIRAMVRDRLEAERRRLRRELERVEAEIENLRKPDR